MLAKVTTADGRVLTWRVALQEEESDSGAHEGETGEEGAEGEPATEGSEGGEHAGDEAPNPILPATNEIIWGSLSFLVLFILLAKFAFPAVKKTMEARTERIRQNLDDAERVRSEAQSILDDYQRQLADARNESARIIEEARQTADQLRRDLMARAEAEVSELRQRATDEMESAKQRAIADLRAVVGDLAIGAAERVVERSIDRDTSVALVNSYIDQVGTQAPR